MSSASVVSTTFTPEDLSSSSPIIGDRPYASLLAFSFNSIYNIYGKSFEKDRHFDAITINLGLLGTKVSFHVQDFIHKNIDSPRPKGWDNQISNGGKFTMLVNYERFWLFKLCVNEYSNCGIDGSFSFGGSAGYYNRVYTSAFIRVGSLDGDKLINWLFSSNTLASANKLIKEEIESNNFNSAYQKKPARVKEGCELFLFMRITPTLMYRNSFLSGQIYTSEDIYTLDEYWINPFICDLEIGFAFGKYWRANSETTADLRSITLFYKITQRTPEFDSKIIKDRSHFFGSVGIQYGF